MEYSSEKVLIKIDDIMILTKIMGSLIERKCLKNDEFLLMRPAYDRLMDSIGKLQRKSVLDKLYPTILNENEDGGENENEK